jgi:alpha-1,3-rhamnosyltransferase
VTPLVSIVVISYNASAYVLETLHSAWQQTYQKVELIISDDGSTDDTVALCTDWLKQYGARFHRTELITSHTNTGTSKNANRGMKVARGIWIKIIAADDVLRPTCLEQYMQFIESNHAMKACCSAQTPFVSVWKPENYRDDKTYQDNYFFQPSLSARQQFLTALFQYSIPSPTFFINRNLLEHIGFYDEEMRIIEDMALYFRVLLSGEKIYYLPHPTVYYREHPASSTKTKNVQVETWKREDRQKRFEKYIAPNANTFTLALHRSLMRYYFKSDWRSRWIKQMITRVAFTCIQLKLIR